MTFLPIVEREFRLAARRKSTFVIRCTAALLALALAGLASLFAGLSMRSGGKIVFNCLSYYVFIIALLGGVFLAADCLSRERREGTLGFLFLTDLKGHDVVLGKFMAISLNAFYGLLAVFPILGLSLLVGGVTGQEFGTDVAGAGQHALFFRCGGHVGFFAFPLVVSRHGQHHLPAPRTYCRGSSRACLHDVRSGQIRKLLFYLSLPKPRSTFSAGE